MSIKEIFEKVSINSLQIRHLGLLLKTTGIPISCIGILALKRNQNMKTKNWYTLKEFAELASKDEKTIRRRRDKLLKGGSHGEWFRLGSRPHKYSYKFLSEFMNPAVFEVISRNRQLANTIDCLHSFDTLEQHLSFMEWDYFVAISYEQVLNKKTCYSLMSELYESFEKYSFGGDVRMFFTTEPFDNRKGYHNHFVLKTEKGNDGLLKEFIAKQCPDGIIDIKPYDKELAGIFYICKNGRDGEDWDVRGTCLEEDGINALRYRPVIRKV